MFDRCVVINLDRRPERLQAFRKRLPIDWPFAPVERVPAFDGVNAEPPPWYGGEHRRRLAGAWACFSSHLAIWRQALADGIESVLIFEDDCVFASDFSARARRFVEHVPDDWHQVYFGGQHLHTETIPPVRVNEHVIRGRNVNRTHAYAIRRPMLEACVETLGQPWPQQTPVNYYNFDYQLGAMHRDAARNVYCPPQWLCGQTAGYSDVSPEVHFLSTLWWKEFPIVDQQEPVPC